MADLIPPPPPEVPLDFGPPRDEIHSDDMPDPADLPGIVAYLEAEGLRLAEEGQT
jgi:hypothetical protein